MGVITRSVRAVAAAFAVSLLLASVAMPLMQDAGWLPVSQASAQAPPAPPAQQETPKLGPQKNDISSCPRGQCIFQDYINPAIKVVSALVGIGVTISIIIGGIEYAVSADNSNKVSAAKTRIVKSIFVLLGYFFFLAFMNWVIPGGIQ